jgi:hypothetical protein
MPGLIITVQPSLVVALMLLTYLPRLATSAKPILPSQIVVITSATNRMIGTRIAINPLLRFFLLSGGRFNYCVKVYPIGVDHASKIHLEKPSKILKK